MEAKQENCERIAKAMKPDFLGAGIPEEQHVAAAAIILSLLEEIKNDLASFAEGVKRGIADYKRKHQ